MIYKTLWGIHIDISKIIALRTNFDRVNDVKYSSLSFFIDVQLRDNPIYVYFDYTNQFHLSIRKELQKGGEEIIELWYNDLLDKWKEYDTIQSRTKQNY